MTVSVCPDRYRLQFQPKPLGFPKPKAAAMPIKRRAAKRRTHRITRQAVEAFTAGDVPGLHRVLWLLPWELSPLEINTPEPPAWTERGPWRDGWRLAHHLRSMLEGPQ